VSARVLARTSCIVYKIGLPVYSLQSPTHTHTHITTATTRIDLTKSIQIILDSPYNCIKVYNYDIEAIDVDTPAPSG